jgi:hypothetical protein
MHRNPASPKAKTLVLQGFCPALRAQCAKQAEKPGSTFPAATEPTKGLTKPRTQSHVCNWRRRKAISQPTGPGVKSLSVQRSAVPARGSGWSATHESYNGQSSALLASVLAATGKGTGLQRKTLPSGSPSGLAASSHAERTTGRGSTGLPQGSTPLDPL